MLKKDQVLEALENGGCIMVDSIYRTARVLDADNNEIDTCRYDTAERIERGEGYTKTYRGGWYATWYIEKEQATQETQEEAEADAYWQAESERVRSAVAADLPGLVVEEEQPAPDYLDEHWPTSNEESGIIYEIHYQRSDGKEKISVEKTVDGVETAVRQIKANGWIITKAVRVEKTDTGYTETDFIPETRQEKSDRENREYCRRIAEEVEIYASGSAYKCPHCGDVHIFEDYEETEHETDDGYTAYDCPHCGEEIEESDLEAVGLYDYFADCLDIEYRCCGLREYRSVRVMVTCGGPNIYIDTQSKAVELYWWGDRASYPIAYDAVDALDEWAAEYWACL